MTGPADAAEPPKAPAPARAPGPWSWRDVVQIAILFALAAALTLAWRLTPLGQYLDPERLAELAAPWRGSRLAILYVVVTSALLGLIGFPITFLTIASVLVFGPLLGTCYSLVGCLAHATSGYFLGRVLTRPSLLAHVDRKGIVRRVLARHGLLSVIVLRVVPVSPFVVVSLLAGATRIPFVTYLAGTAIGAFPGQVLVALASDRLLAVLQDPGPASLLALGVAIAAVVLGAAWLRHRFRHHAHDHEQQLP